ncbi:antitermination NusB domain protein, putative [Medicago truncatula]|uniref:Antitermination NusB domain protein, putative n=1 Tax=Medicago truncatula TaxID=3880 RepID=G7JHL1_MEDTR|nr:antitermination NusB domain protein, putative [Medicago truncatula]
MEGALLPLSSPSTSSSKLNHRFCFPSSLLNNHRYSHFPKFLPKPKINTVTSSPLSLKCSLRGSTLALDKDETSVSEITDTSSISLPKLDKTGRFCSPRAARELALDWTRFRLFEKRMNERREVGYEFNKEKLLEYNHMSFGGPPVIVETDEDANELLRNIQLESAIEEEVLAAPPKLVYSRLILRFTRKLLVAVRDRWDSHVPVINKVIPPNWQEEPAGKILELSILHLAMSEIAVLDTRHQIVINEAVDLAKRFCDGAAPPYH